jgi:hypothetical protein
LQHEAELAPGVDNLTEISEGCVESMNTRRPSRHLSLAIGLATAFACTSAHADIYTWVDASGKVNLSNRAPPEGARVTNVYREDPAVHATAEAARAAAARDELKALNDRVTQLERDLDAANDRPPAAPVVYAPGPPAPAAYPPVIVQTIVVPSAPAYADCSTPWAGCGSPGFFGYPGGIVVVSSPASHRFDGNRRGEHMRPPASRPAPLPVGAIPDPVNLFPNTRGHR